MRCGKKNVELRGSGSGQNSGKTVQRLDTFRALCSLMLLLVASAAATGCGRPRHIEVKDAELVPYTEAFVSDLKRVDPDFDYGNIEVRFDGSLPDTQYGIARMVKDSDNSGADKIVLINPRKFSPLVERDKAFVIYHELGHAALYRDHVPADQCRGSIMCSELHAKPSSQLSTATAREVASSGSASESEWSALVNELFMNRKVLD